jgi:thymidylate synthase (FAD)
MTARPGSPGADALIGVRHPIGPAGFVALVDYHGTDAAIARAARVSYGRHDEERGAEADARLIGFLVRHRHTSPLEMARLVFHVRAPIFVARQWIRHRMASINEVSARYTELPADCYRPPALHAEPASGANQQGRGVVLDPDSEEVFGARYFADLATGDAVDAYQRLRRAGVAKEQARMVLPVAVYTEWTWASDLHNLLHFLRLRTAANAQHEIREYAAAIEGIVAAAFPLTHAAWVEHARDAVTLSASAQRAIAAALRAGAAPDLSALPPRERADVEAWIAGGGL